MKAIILVGANPDSGGEGKEHFAQMPLALADVLGESVLHHVIKQLETQRVTSVAVISETEMPVSWRRLWRESRCVTWKWGAGAQLWRAAEAAFSDHAQSGAEEVLIIRMGAYAEIDLDSFLQAHLDGPGHVTRALDPAGEPMDILLVSGSRRNEAAYLFRHQLQESRSYCGTCQITGYRNRLGSARDLRCLGVDGLLQRNHIKPVGQEVRPGVWLGRGVHVQRGARVLAPAFIGDRAKIRANAVITRCSIVEHHCEVDRGSVVEDATVLPLTYVGSGLDICRAVVGGRRVASLERNIEVAIADPKLINALSPSPAVRAAAGAAALAAFLPTQLFRGLFSASRSSGESELPEAATTPSRALNTPSGFPGSARAAEAHSFQRTWQ